MRYGQTTILGTLWTYASFYSGKVLVFISTIILARLLTKEDFGVVGYALTTISFLDVLRDLGVGAALIYYREDPKAADTAFWLSLGIASGLCALTWLFGPLIGEFFNDPRAIPVTRALAFSFPINALGSVHDNLLSKKLDFRAKLAPDLAQSFGKGAISIGLAWLGAGPWSLIAGQLGGALVGVLVIWKVQPWHPSFRFARELARPLLSFGLHIVMVNIVAITLLNIDYVFVGRYLGPAALGVYTVAFRIPELLILQFCAIISKVIFPVYSKMREDPGAFRRGFLKTTRYVSLITVPIGLGLALVAEPFTLTVFTSKWAEAIPVIRAISIYAVLLSLAYNAGDIYKAQGRASVLTQLSLVRAVLLIPALYWAVTGPSTIEAVGWTHAAVAFVGGTLNLIVAARMLGTPFHQVLGALSSAFIAASLMTPAVLAALYLSAGLAPVLRLIIGVGVGGLVYGGALFWLERELVSRASQTLRTVLVARRLDKEML